MATNCGHNNAPEEYAVKEEMWKTVCQIWRACSDPTTFRYSSKPLITRLFGGQDELNTPGSPSSLARMGSHFVTREAFGLGKVKEDRKK